MLSESFFASTGGPPISSRTEIAKDVGIYSYQLHPTLSAKATFKKSSASVNCLAVNESHIFVAQKDKAHVHVYSRTRGNQEALIPFSEKITSLALVQDVLLLGTAQGRLILWEICTGRQVTTPPCHVQAITCIAASPYHVLTGSDDSNIHVWSLPHLLDLDVRADHEPDRSFSNHRAAITSVAVAKGTNPETAVCISSSKDKTCVIWNYQTGEALRTLLFPSVPLCLCLDPCTRAVFVATEDNSVFAVEIFGDNALLGPRSEGLLSTAVQVTTPLGVAEADDGPASCIAVSFDGTTLLTGHTKAQLETSLSDEARLTRVLNSRGFPANVLEDALISLQHSDSGSSAGQGANEPNEELWHIINEQRALQQLTFQKYVEAKAPQ
ncbi:unnamed protein product [Parascedosporium putredinis]|uniref:Pre-rRNA-processing protein IPI3 n=1 Tax=Parascedosporium putredinis TaxID=1442378 RepID=A0A9P1M7Z0_9PEZI|nr:unnamed protein product [Parascedosporium putredinis]CAI7988168.1 unnamed protein product [Parascedosporium putredinis]